MADLSFTTSSSCAKGFLDQPFTFCANTSSALGLPNGPELLDNDSPSTSSIVTWIASSLGTPVREPTVSEASFALAAIMDVCTWRKSLPREASRGSEDHYCDFRYGVAIHCGGTKESLSHCDPSA